MQQPHSNESEVMRLTTVGSAGSTTRSKRPRPLPPIAGPGFIVLRRNIKRHIMKASAGENRRRHLAAGSPSVYTTSS